MWLKVLLGALVIFLGACGQSTGFAPTLSGATSTSNDSGGGGSASPTTCSTNCRIFLTSVSYDGNLGGISGADAKCNSDSNKPSGDTTYKAMVVGGTTRRACTSNNCATGGTSEHIDWVLQPSKIYYRSDGTTAIGTTTSNGVFVAPLTNSISGAADQYYIGVSAGWIIIGADCLAWTSNSNGSFGFYGGGSQTNFPAWSFNISACNVSNKLICVEQ